jgi:hypothetical protein
VTDLAPLGRPAPDRVIHARKSADAIALCGAPPGSAFTTTRGYVTCERCKSEIAARLQARR